ncbi:ABC transporter permease [Diplocloster agilis]|uniref:ABC transporter permease n=1 Tax=Diplocloster agilis TaxID=2850323 RepID=UPI0008224A7F|nr:ABC transporter permease [Suonthocola fibrivorans]MCU6733594.1 ABC transporter permease [Suonthocola fibrivorans]SCI99496.1 Uncharacterised protein [uncultured Clostridium sp.]
MKRIARRLVFTVGLAAAVCCIWKAVMLMASPAYDERTHLLALEAPVPAPVMELDQDVGGGDESDSDAADSEGIPYALFGEKKRQTLTNPSLWRSAQADVIWFQGPAGVICPEAAWFPEEDQKGCMISRKTAMDLFGSTDVAGHTVQYQDMDYEIRQVLPLDLAVILFRPLARSGTPGYTYRYLIYQAPPGISQEKAKQQIITQVPYAVTEIRLHWYRVGERLSLALPLAILYVLLVSGIFRRYRPKGTVPLRKSRRWSRMLMVTGTACLILWGIQPALPQLPSGWTDLSAWWKLFRSWQTELSDLMNTEPAMVQTRMRAHWLWILHWTVWTIPIGFILRFIDGAHHFNGESQGAS